MYVWSKFILPIISGKQNHFTLQLSSLVRIHKNLNKLNAKCHSLSLSLDSDKWIIFSDHHRGIGDGADDFAPCKQTYLAALEHYAKEGYSLILLGDVEEFWENTLKKVITKYADVLEVEKLFYDKSQLLKVWGNHDDAWNHLQKVSTYLFPFFKNIATYEAINFEVVSNGSKVGNMLLVHGHQGSGASDKFASISKWFVRIFWRNFQRIFKFPLSTPAKSKRLKDRHDIAMHTWAKGRDKQIVVCGHTHQPVFMSKNHLDILQKEREDIRASGSSETDRLAAIESRIAELEKKTTAIGTLVADTHPCYFNTGCCSYADGDITGLEISEGKISLVKWANDKRKIISSEKLEDIYATL